MYGLIHEENALLKNIMEVIEIIMFASQSDDDPNDITKL